MNLKQSFIVGVWFATVMTLCPFGDIEGSGAIAKSELLEFRQYKEGGKTFTERILEGQKEV